MLFLSWACVQTDIENQKEDAGCRSCIFASLWRWMIAISKLSGKHNAPQSYTFMPDNLWLGVIMLIPFTRRTAVCTWKASSENCVRAQRCIRAISTNGIFSQAPILSTSGAERRRWEHYQMCLSSSHQHDPGGRYRYRVTFSAWLPDINAISLPYYHGNISQSIRLNKWLFFLASISLLPSPSFSPILSWPAPLVFPAPEPITQPPWGPGLHNRVSSQPSYSSRIA